MRFKIRFTSADVADIRARNEAGETKAGLAREYGCNVCTIERYLRGDRKPSDERKKPPPDPKPTRTTCCTAVLAAEARRLHSLGMGITGIGAKTGLPYRTIAEVIDG